MSQPATPSASGQSPASPKGSPIRLIVLLLILAVVLTGFLVDVFYMYDSVKAASKRLEDVAEEAATRPFEKSGKNYLTHLEVAKAIGFAPTSTTVENGQLKENYRWWGKIPLQRRFITVEYNDADGMMYKGYTISNRNLFGQDEDEMLTESLKNQPLPPAPEIPEGGPTMSAPPQPQSPPDSAKPSDTPPENPSTDSPDKPASDPPSSESSEKPAADKPENP